MNYSINARNLSYRQLNQEIRGILKDNGSQAGHLELNEVCGHRYIGDGLKADLNIRIKGVPGNDLGAFMDGPTIEVLDNGQDGIGNTMNSGRIIIHGDAGDILGYSMRGGEIYVKGNAGYRCGIHMKSYGLRIPVIVIGGRAGNFLGEYMAGGLIIVLGLQKPEKVQSIFSHENREAAGSYIGTGMHGGNIFIRGDIATYKLGKEVKKQKLEPADIDTLDTYIEKYSEYFSLKKDIKARDFIKLVPYSHRPYGKLYAY